jgi:hypothetical protein
MIVGCGKLWPGLVMNLLWAIVLIGFTLGSKQFGAVGISASLLISYSAHSVIVAIYTLSIVTYPLSDR